MYISCHILQDYSEDLAGKIKSCLSCKKVKWRLDILISSVCCLCSELSPCLRFYPEAWLIALQPEGPFFFLSLASWNDFLLCPSGVTNSWPKGIYLQLWRKCELCLEVLTIYLLIKGKSHSYFLVWVSVTNRSTVKTLRGLQVKCLWGLSAVQ